MALTFIPAKEPAPTETALRWPVGVTSPLWIAFAGAAAVGATYYWMTRWARPINIEAASNQTTLPAPLRVALATPAAMVEPVIVAEPVAEVAPLAEISAPAPVSDVVASIDVSPAQTATIEADDLTELVGVGPKLAASLADNGITRFAQIADWTETDLAHYDALLNLKGRAERDAWIAQAKRLASQSAD